MFERFAARAAQIKPLRVLATVLVYPFYLIGFVGGLVVWLVLMAWAAGVEGFKDGKK
jgi:hypothetical protein